MDHAGEHSESEPEPDSRNPPVQSGRNGRQCEGYAKEQSAGQERHALDVAEARRLRVSHCGTGS